MNKTNKLVILSAFLLSLAATSLNSYHLNLFKPFQFFKPKMEFLPNIDLSNEADTKDAAIRVALLLDTSSSMSGLIEQTKSQLWNILNELNTYTILGETPKILISLYEYGKTPLGTESGYIKQLSAFTGDMDRISELLFSLNTNGGDEYCGQVMYRSLHDLNWGANSNDLKLIYIAGNESFAQGSYRYQDVCANAKELGITINTIYCGDEREGINLAWFDGARIGGGEYMYINHNSATKYYSSPYDKTISELSTKLNHTYIPIGTKGKEAKLNQGRQDMNATSYSTSNAVDRANYKVSKNYSNTNWDLVDAYKVDVSILKEKKKLPKDMQNLSDHEIVKIIEAKEKERASIKDQIVKLNVKRAEHIQEEKAKDPENSDLQNSIIKSVNKVAKDKKYERNSPSN
jgi:hypothetical protein